MNSCWLCNHTDRETLPYVGGSSGLIFLCKDSKACTRSYAARGGIAELARKNRPITPPETDRRTLSAGGD